MSYFSRYIHVLSNREVGKVRREHVALHASGTERLSGCSAPSRGDIPYVVCKKTRCYVSYLYLLEFIMLLVLILEKKSISDCIISRAQVCLFQNLSGVRKSSDNGANGFCLSFTRQRCIFVFVSATKDSAAAPPSVSTAPHLLPAKRRIIF
jgi:hypothetical protein